MITMTRAPQGASAVSDQLANLIALAKDPDAYAAKLAELQDAEDRANAAIAASDARKSDLDTRERDIASRADALGRQAVQLEADTDQLAKDSAAFDADRLAQVAKLNELARSLNAREADLDARAAEISKQEVSTASLNRAAVSARDAADARLADLRAIAQSFEPIRAQLAALA